MIKIIIISGKASSGKNFLADRLQSTLEKVYNFKVMQLAFADTLKMVCREVCGWDGKKGPHGRELLQRVGTDIVHPNNQMCWTNCVKEIIMGLHTEFDYFIIPDARFPHEIDGVRDLGYPIYTVMVHGKTNLTGSMANHISETALSDYKFDYDFNNSEYDVHVFFHQLGILLAGIGLGNEEKYLSSDK